MSLMSWVEDVLQGCAWSCCACLRHLVEEDSSLEIVLAVLKAIDEEEKRHGKRTRTKKKLLKRKRPGKNFMMDKAQPSSSGDREEDEEDGQRKLSLDEFGGGIEGALLDVFLSLRLREKEVSASFSRTPSSSFSLKYTRICVSIPVYTRAVYVHTSTRVQASLCGSRVLPCPCRTCVNSRCFL